MSARYFSYDDVGKNLSSISDKLRDVSLYKKGEIEKIEEVRRNIEVAKEYWLSQPVPSSDIVTTPLASGAGFISQVYNYVDGLEPQYFTGEVLGTVLGAGNSIASAASTFYQIAPPPQPLRDRLEVKFIEIKGIAQRKEDRDKIKSLLQKLSYHLGSMYGGVWENIETNFSDPVRGAAFLMREVVSQVLDYLAPKGLIKKTSGFVPDGSVKGGITRRHRLECIAANKAKDNFNKELIEKSIDNFLDTYDALCNAHKRGPLDRPKIESFLLQANDLLIMLLSAVKFN